jgi:hypothetical protein
MSKIIRLSQLSLFVALLFSVIAGCASQTEIRRDVATQLKKSSILLPYDAERIYGTQPDYVLEALTAVLASQGARVLSWDNKAGVVSWYDTGGAFVPLPDMTGGSHMYGMLDKQAATLKGVQVYGCAHVTTSSSGAWLSVRTIGRDVTSGRRILSDGSYERNLANSVTRKIQRVTAGQSVIDGHKEPVTTHNRPAETNYVEMYQSGFKGFPKLSSHDVVKMGDGERYPVTDDQLWKACIDVITQYALIPYVDSNEKVVAFAQKQAVPRSVNSKMVKPVDVIMAITVLPDANDPGHYSRIHISWLDGNLRPCLLKRIILKNEEGKETLSGTPIEVAAAMSANDLVRQIDAQLFYNEKLGNKLLKSLN